MRVDVLPRICAAGASANVDVCHFRNIPQLLSTADCLFDVM